MRASFRLSCFVSVFAFCFLRAQSPVFGPEIPVTINGYSLDAMEAALSADGNGLFFNSLNDGVTTSLYYATRVNDSTFNLAGLVPVVNQTVTPRLDGVASLDSANNYYWVSTRQYPSIPYNLHRIRFLAAGYSNFGRVYGDFYHIGPGWLIMDASISYQGDQLLYCNALFNNCLLNMPCESTIGVAGKINDSTFNKLANSDELFADVNDTADYVVYAPHLSKNGLELYYSRLFKAIPRTEVLVATRPNLTAPFTFDKVIDDDTLSEAPVLSTEGDKLYYHKKTGSRFNLVLRYRQIPTALSELSFQSFRLFYPNPASDYIISSEDQPLQIFDLLGNQVLPESRQRIEIRNLPSGLYIVREKGTSKVQRLIKSDQ